MPGHRLLDGGGLAGQADQRADPVGVAQGVDPGDVAASRRQGSVSVAIMRTNVDLPAPFGPSTASTPPVGADSVSPASAFDLAEALREAVGLDHLCVMLSTSSYTDISQSTIFLSN